VIFHILAKSYGIGSTRKRYTTNKYRTKNGKILCYNCNDAGHLAEKCPFEKREDKPRFEKGATPKLRPNLLNMRRDDP
jgi:hypothetical protein